MRANDWAQCLKKSCVSSGNFRIYEQHTFQHDVIHNCHKSIASHYRNNKDSMASRMMTLLW